MRSRTTRSFVRRRVRSMRSRCCWRSSRVISWLHHIFLRRVVDWRACAETAATVRPTMICQIHFLWMQARSHDGAAVAICQHFAPVHAVFTALSHPCTALSALARARRAIITASA
jgi:hypothetical protein